MVEKEFSASADVGCSAQELPTNSVNCKGQSESSITAEAAEATTYYLVVSK